MSSKPHNDPKTVGSIFTSPILQIRKMRSHPLAHAGSIWQAGMQTNAVSPKLLRTIEPCGSVAMVRKHRVATSSPTWNLYSNSEKCYFWVVSAKVMATSQHGVCACVHVCICVLMTCPLNRYSAVHRIRVGLVCLKPETVDYLIFKWVTDINEAFMSFLHQESQFYLTEPCFKGEFPTHKHKQKKRWHTRFFWRTKDELPAHRHVHRQRKRWHTR